MTDIPWTPWAGPCRRLMRSQNPSGNTTTAWSSEDDLKQLQKTMLTMLADPSLSDVSLVVEGIDVPAHKAVLAAWSRPFHAMFTLPMLESRHKCRVVIEDAEHKHLSVVLEYLYSGRVGLNDQNVMPVAALANRYEIVPLMTQCEGYMKWRLSPSNVCRHLLAAEYHKCASMASFALDYLAVHFDEVHHAGSDDFNALASDMVLRVLQHEGLTVDEETIFLAVDNWAKAWRRRRALRDGATSTTNRSARTCGEQDPADVASANSRSVRSSGEQISAATGSSRGPNVSEHEPTQDANQTSDQRHQGEPHHASRRTPAAAVVHKQGRGRISIGVDDCHGEVNQRGCINSSGISESELCPGRDTPGKRAKVKEQEQVEMEGQEFRNKPTSALHESSDVGGMDKVVVVSNVVPLLQNGGSIRADTQDDSCKFRKGSSALSPEGIQDETARTSACLTGNSSADTCGHLCSGGHSSGARDGLVVRYADRNTDAGVRRQQPTNMNEGDGEADGSSCSSGDGDGRATSFSLPRPSPHALCKPEIWPEQAADDGELTGAIAVATSGGTEEDAFEELPEEERACVDQLFEEVRFPLISTSFLCQVVEKSAAVSGSRVAARLLFEAYRFQALRPDAADVDERFPGNHRVKDRGYERVLFGEGEGCVGTVDDYSSSLSEVHLVENVQRRDEKYWLPGQPEEAYVCVRLDRVRRITKFRFQNRYSEEFELAVRRTRREEWQVIVPCQSSGGHKDIKELDLMRKRVKARHVKISLRGRKRSCYNTSVYWTELLGF